MAGDEAEVTLRLRGGRVLSSHVRHATGSTARPMTDAQLAEKFQGLTRPALGQAGCDRLLQAALDTENAQDIASIIALSH
jgi:2-methylcitrate dehydratase PrpD